jgi:hypothetical protein
LALVLLSGVAAFFVNWSGFLVMGACSALTHTVLGQLKSVVTIIGGVLLFSQPYPPKAIVGAGGAIVAMMLYTRFNLDEQAARVTAAAAERKPIMEAAADDGGRASGNANGSPAPS